MAKQTLKSLLGISDSRTHTDLDLDEQTFRAPEIKAGNYQVSAPVYARTNSMGQLADAMGRFSGPILSKYSAIQQAEQQSIADATELLSAEELKQYQAGDMSSVLASIQADEDRFDDLQRKKVISYLENPNNHKRAYERVGERIGGIFREDLQLNMDEYALDPDFNFQNKADELAKEYGLEGLGSQSFYKSVNDTSETYGAKIKELRNTNEQEQANVETVGILSKHITTDNPEAFTTSFDESKKSRTYEEQKTLFSSVVSSIAGDDPHKAERMITSYREGETSLGNGVIEDEFADELDLIVAQAEERTLNLQNLEIAKTKDAFDNGLNTVQTAIELGDEIPASIEIDLTEDNTLTIDTSQVTDLSGYAAAGINAISNLEDGVMTQAERTQHTLSFAKLRNDQSTQSITRRTSAGVASAVSNLTGIYGTEFNGQNIYDYDNTGIVNRSAEAQAELFEIVDEVYRDKQYTTTDQRQLAASKAVGLYVVEKTKEHEEFSNQVKEQKAQTDFNTAIGLARDVEDTYLSAQGDYWKSDSVEDEEAMPNMRGMEKIALSFADATRAGVEKIRTRLRSDSESGLNDVEFLKLLETEAANYIDGRDALFKDDINHDGIINGITKNVEDPNKIKETLPKVKKENETASTRITFTEDNNTAGLVNVPKRKHNYHSKYNFTPIQRAANSTQSYVKRITEPVGFVKNAFKSGHMNYDTIDENGKVLGELSNSHEYARYQSELFQAGQEIGTRYQQISKEQQEIFEEHSVSFFNGETTIRATKNQTPVTIQELESGSMRNVKFNGKEIDASATLVIPFKLLNSYMSDPDNTTDSQDLLLTRYARELGYINPNLDDVGVKEMLLTLISHQAAAYANRGFVFTDKKIKN